jgi:hypothetical protein
MDNIFSFIKIKTMAKAKRVAKESGEKKSSSASSAAKGILKTLESFPVNDQNIIIAEILSEIKLERMGKVQAHQEMHNEIAEGLNSFAAAVQAGLNAQPQVQQ